MTETIQWESDINNALAMAKKENKPVLLDFFNPGWIGCQQMDAVTYPDQAVIDFLSDAVVALRVPSDFKPLSEDFNIKWTPALITLGPNGKEHHRTIGFLEPKELIARLLLGEGKYFFDNDKFPEALKALEKIPAEYKNTYAVPEAIFWRGVSEYKNTNDPIPLKTAYELLSKDFPGGEWTQRAYPYRLIG